MSPAGTRQKSDAMTEPPQFQPVGKRRRALPFKSHSGHALKCLSCQVPGRPRHLLRKSWATLSHSASTVMYSRTPATKSFILYPPVSLVFDIGIRDSFPPVVLLIFFSPLTTCLPLSYASSFMGPRKDVGHPRHVFTLAQITIL